MRFDAIKAVSLSLSLSHKLQQLAACLFVIKINKKKNTDF
jgi:hypothetical protein